MREIKTYELIKHSATIHIVNSLSITERKIYNIFLKNAYLNLLKQQIHKISMSDLMMWIGREGKNYENLKYAIEKLMRTVIKWNVLGKDRKNKWGATTFLASAKIEDGICTYEYSSLITEFLANPNVYARLNLNIQKKFGNKHALTLWEFLNDELCRNDNKSVETSFILIDDIKNLFGSLDKYKSFSIFNRDVLKKAINEINNLSDIKVKIILKRERKRVIAISFSIKRKEELDHHNASISQKLIKNNPKILSRKQIKDENRILKSLKQILIEEFKISEVKAIKLLSEYKLEDVEKSLKYVRDKINQKFKIINIAAYTIKAIKEGWMQTESSTISKAKTRVQLIVEAEEYLEELEDKIKVESWYNVWINLKSQMDILEFKSWIAHLNYEDEYEGIVRLYVNNSFIQKEIKNKYGYILLSTWQEYNPKIKKIEIQFKKF